MLRNDSLSKVLYIDLSKKDYTIEDRNDLFSEYIGGTGVATELLFENCPKGIEPYSKESPIIFAIGAITGMFPLASKTIAMFKSPHTGNLGESHCGGRTAISIRMAGFGAIVITGKSDIPIYLSISEGKVAFKNASTLWGMASIPVATKILGDREENAGSRSIMCIGRAGENLISYSSLTADTFRHFGRLGLGAIFGSKNLKAIVVGGKDSIYPTDSKQYRETYDEIFKAATSSSLMKKYHELGTPENIIPLNKLKGFPTKNLQRASFDEGVDKISGEHFAEEFLGRRLACAHCPVACIHIAALREPYEDEPYFYKTKMIGYDYELIFAVGSMLGGSDPKNILRLIDTIEAVGLDAMSSGGVLSWATEAFEKGIITEKETLDIKPVWNDYQNYIKMIEYIVSRKNDFYKALGLGAEHAAKTYGGEDFALTFGKNEMPGYHTGPSSHSGYILGARHSHLDNAGYSIDQKVLITNKLEPKDLALKIINEEKWRQILSSLVICFFARGIYSEEIVLKALKSAGFDFTKEELLKISEKIYNRKYEFKFREGFSLDNYRLPKRIFEVVTPTGMIDENYMREVIKEAKKIIVES